MKDKRKAYQKRFLVIFLCVMGLSILALQLEIFDRWMLTPYQRAIAQASGYMLKPIGITCHIEADTIHLKTMSLQVDRSCTGIIAMFAFLAAVLGYPSSLEEKLTGIGLGIVLISLFNLIRVFSLCLLGIYAPRWVGPAHNVGWQILLIFLILFSWLFWEEKLVKS